VKALSLERGIGSLAGLLLFATASQAQISDTIRLDSGLVSTSVISASGVRSFRGLPFGAPPVG